MYEIELERLLIGPNSKVSMRATEQMISKYENDNNVKFSNQERNKIYSGQIEDYVTFEIFCHNLNIEHLPRERFSNNLVRYSNYLESLFCKYGYVIATRTYTELEDNNLLYTKNRLNKEGEHILIAVPNNYNEVFTSYQKDTLKEINNNVTSNVDFNIYTYPDYKKAIDGYIEPISISKFYSKIDNKTLLERTKSFFRKK